MTPRTKDTNSPLEPDLTAKLAQAVKEISSAKEEVVSAKEELKNESFYRKQSATRTRWIVAAATAVIVASFFITFAQSRSNGQGVSLLKECVIAPTTPSPKGEENCFERSQNGSAAAIGILAADFDAIVQQRDQELLNAINSHQSTIVFKPVPITAPPTTTTTATVPKGKRTTTTVTTRPSSSTTTTATTTAPSSSTSTTSPPPTTTCLTIDGLEVCKG